VVGVRLAAPADEEALGDRGRGIDLALGHRRPARPARGLRDERQRHDRGAGEVLARLLVRDVEQRPHPPLGAEQGQRGLDVDARVGRADAEGMRLGRRQPGLEAPVDEQAPDALERHRADELLDVDPAVAQRPALAVGLGDGGLHLALSRNRRALAWLPHSAIEHQRRRAAGERS
jgi:hypothetical protein